MEWIKYSLDGVTANNNCNTDTADSIQKFDSKSNRTADSIRTQKKICRSLDDNDDDNILAANELVGAVRLSWLVGEATVWHSEVKCIVPDVAGDIHSTEDHLTDVHLHWILTH